MNRSMTNQQFRELAEKCEAGTATPEEQKTFEETYALMLKRYPNWNPTVMGDREEVRIEIFKNLSRSVNEVRKQKKVFTLAKYLSAAVLLLVFSLTLYIVAYRVEPQGRSVNKEMVVAPGGNRAILTLADGRSIDLTDAKEGMLVEQEGLTVLKQADGQLLYKVQEEPTIGAKAEITYNTISTPRGGQYQVVLSDGTKVWLNASSSLKFPSSFEGTTVRHVEMTGEAYFEVAKDKSRRFVVRSTDQDVTVLGTHFNINSYKDDGAVRTTLLEGRVKVNGTFAKSDGGAVETVLKAGEQAVLTHTGIKVVEKNLEQAVDWKNGDFIFQKESISDIMSRVARWYDVKVVYEDGLDKGLTFSGTMSRSRSLNDLLDNLSSTGEVRFKIEDSIVRVYAAS